MIEEIQARPHSDTYETDRPLDDCIPWKILIVDDDDEVHKLTRLVLGDVTFEERPISFLSALSSREAPDILAVHPDIALVFLDVVMETDDAGLKLVQYIREDLKNDRIQIVLRTGQSGRIPEQEIVLRYGINDYKSKLELTNEKLFITVISSLRAYKNAEMAYQFNQRLETELEKQEKIEDHVRSLNKILEERVSKRTLELETANKKLKEAFAQVQELVCEADSGNRAKGEFLANMSHEIRTPMNGILGMTELLLGTILDDEQKEYAQIIRSSSKSLLTIINAILDYSKMEAGKMALESVNFNLRTLIEDVFDLLAIKAYQKNIECLSMIQDNVPVALVGDPGRFRQVLINLLGNAIKFTEQGEIKMNVRLEEDHRDEVIVRFEVSDTGIGIPGDKIETIFQSFSQVDFSLSRKYEGTGLGLAITKQLVEMMGGKIGVVSDLGRGSVFWFNVLLKKQTCPAHKPVTVPVAVRKQTILVAMDNPSSREALIRQLESIDCHAVEAGSGAQALEIIRHARKMGKPFTIIIAGLDSPIMDSVAFGQQVRQTVLGEQPAMIILKSAGRNGNWESLERLGFNAYMTKPVRISKLALALKSVSEGKSAPCEPHFVIRGGGTQVLSDNHILIVEDNVVNQKVTLKYIERLGYKADIVNNGVEAIDALKVTPYDLVLMDVQMPVMDGFLATQMIRDPQSGVLNGNVPILAMTAHAMNDDKEKCLEAGMNGYISKPINQQILAESIREMLK